MIRRAHHNKREVVLDASAILALRRAEPGADMVAAMLPGAVVSTVNLSEVVARLAEGGMSEVAIRQDLDGLGLELVPFGVEQAYTAGLLRPLTRHLGLSLGDRACLSLAQQLGVPAFTTDGAWAELNVGIDVRLVR